MGWSWCNPGVHTMKTLTVFLLMMLCACNGARRAPQRRQDTELYSPAPSVESLQEIAEAMGAAGFEHYTEGKALVKRLIPANSQPDLDIVEYQGVIGRAGVDFPAYPNIPPTGFNCKNVPTGYYADLETDCQVFHICDTSRKISFLCPNGTIFSQSHLICDWWFKVDCASAPALYESSAEYYSNEQKKSQKITQSLSKNQDLQQIGTDTNIRAEPRRGPVIVPSTTERLYRSRQRHIEVPKATAKTFQTLFTDSFNPTQRTAATTAFEHRRKSLVQLITNNFGNPPARTTPATYVDNPVFKTTAATADVLHGKETQVAAETASFTNNNNRQYLQDFNNKNYRPYPVFNPTVSIKPKTKSNPNLTTLYDIRDKTLNQPKPTGRTETTTAKRSTLLPYSRSYTTIIERQEPYTRPGVSLLKNYLHKEKNRTVTTTEKAPRLTARHDRSDQTHQENKINVETKSTFESATKIPHTTRAAFYTETASSNRHEILSTTNHITQPTTESSYQERRERLMKKLNLDKFVPTESTVSTIATDDSNIEDKLNKSQPAVEPSLSPKSLHSLAIYYATALDNLSTTTSPDETETVTPTFDEYETMDDTLPALFSRQTINKYSNLFNHQSSAELLEEIRDDPNGTYNELAEDLSVQQSQNPIASSPQIRELAQVFTHALSAYLQDPVQFRKVLSDIRPTHPSFGDIVTTTEESINTEPTTTVNEEDDEILGFSDDQNDILSREPKALRFPTTYGVTYESSSTTARPVTEVVSAAYVSSTTPRSFSPFRCCGKISASYTSAAPTSTTPSYSSTAAATIHSINNLSSNYSETISTTESDYSLHKYGGFQNNALTLEDSPYGVNRVSSEGKPLSEYIEATNLPTAWGIDPSVSTVSGFESQKIKTTTISPTTSVFFTETDSVELENDEELQRAHSQSFAAPQSNSIRHGKQISYSAVRSEPAKKPAEELEAPTLRDEDITTVQTTTQQPITTPARNTETETLTTTPSPFDNDFTSPDDEKTTNQFAWSSSYGNWHSTVIDPITLNDGLSPTAPEQGQTENTYAPNTATTPTDYTATEQVVSSTANYETITTANSNNVTARLGRILKDSSTETAQDLTTITDTVVEKAKELMNVTTAEKLINVMKKTKSKTVKRLILLLIQTCDDDHNTTAEASKQALLEALMAVSQKDMDEMAKEGETTELPTTEIDRSTVFRKFERINGDRRGKSLSFDASAVNSLSNSATTEYSKTTTELEATASTPLSLRTNAPSRRGVRKYHTKPTTVEPSTTKVPFVDTPKAEAQISATDKTNSDTRALELLRSLYSIAARWG